MTSQNGRPPGGRTLSWPGVGTGLVGVPLAVFVVDRVLKSAAPYLLVPAGLVVIGFVLSMPNDPFWRGVATGLVGTLAVGLIVLAGLCLSIVGS